MQNSVNIMYNLYICLCTNKHKQMDEKKNKNTTKRVGLIMPIPLMERVEKRTDFLFTDFSNYVRQLILKDLETFEQSQSKQP